MTASPEEVFSRWSKKYGDVFGFKVGERLFVVINRQDAIKEAVVKHGLEFAGRPDFYSCKIYSPPPLFFPSFPLSSLMWLLFVSNPDLFSFDSILPYLSNYSPVFHNSLLSVCLSFFLSFILSFFL